MSFPPNSTLAILGGAGKAGRPLVEAALAAGYRVRLLLRHPDRFPIRHEHLTIFPGDARDPAALRTLLSGCSALLSTLGHPKGESEPMLATVTERLLPLLTELGIRRYLTVTSLYDTGREQPDETTRQAAAFMQQTFPRHMADREREFQLLAASDLDWTYVRLPYLVPTPATGHLRTSLDHLPGQQLSTADLADFLLEQLHRSAFVRQAPFVANG